MFRRSLALVAGALPASLIGIVGFLVIYAWPAIRFNGWGFALRDKWNLGNLYSDPVTIHGVSVLPGAQYGILFLIAGTFLSSAIALIVAIPLGVGAAIFLSEALDGALRDALSLFVEMLAAIPSVVFGLWGYVVLIPFLGHHLFPLMARLLGSIPIFAGPVGSGYGLFSAGLVLAMMIVPLIASTLRDAMVSQPQQLREAGAGIGATRFETAWRIILPNTRKVLVGASILALGRAMGETMAVLMVSGNALNYLPRNIYAPISTMASFIVSQLDSALQDPTGLAVRSLAEIALILTISSVAVNALARLMMRVWTGQEGAQA